MEEVQIYQRKQHTKQILKGREWDGGHYPSIRDLEIMIDCEKYIIEDLEYSGDLEFLFIDLLIWQKDFREMLNYLTTNSLLEHDETNLFQSNFEKFKRIKEEFKKIIREKLDSCESEINPPDPALEENRILLN